MACLGGTHDEPRDWMARLADGSEQRQHGRLCARFIPGVTPRHTKRQYVFRDTNPRICSSCPLYRWRKDGRLHRNGVDKLGWKAISMDEYAAFVRAQKAIDDEGDTTLMDRFWQMLEGEPLPYRTPAFLCEEGHNYFVADQRAAQRAADPERYRAYMRDYMRRRRADAKAARAVSFATTHVGDLKSASTSEVDTDDGN